MSGLTSLRLFRPRIKPDKPKIRKREVPVITYNMSYRSPNYSKRKSEIDSIIVHHTGGLFPGTARWLCNPDPRDKDGNKLGCVSTHILITTDGIPYELVSDHRRAWHAGRGAFDSNKDGIISYAEKYWNDHSLGIELEAVDPYVYTSQQLNMLDKVIYSKLYEHKLITVDKILGHKEIASDRKIDPANFEMDELRTKMEAWIS